METPVAERLHIAILGTRNSGKSSLVNALTGQKVSLVSDMPGTTTDPVSKAMEIPGAGPCVLVDTAGFDDDGQIGDLRVARTGMALDRTDMAILVFRQDNQEPEKYSDIYSKWCKILSDRNIPTIPVLNISSHAQTAAPSSEIQTDIRAMANIVTRLTGKEPLTVNAATGEGMEAIFDAIRNIAEKNSADNLTLTGNLAKSGDTVLLVMPQDSEAPKGRLILPQVQTIRELMDKGCTAICCTPETMGTALASLSCPPDLIITDSQAFAKVWAARPEGCRVTSFSILFAAYKGDLKVFLEGAKALDRLTEGSRILIAEACTHAPATEDIGRVKIPAMLKKRLGNGIGIDIVAGNNFPEDLSGYDQIIHCGACMFNRKYVMHRICSAAKQNIPITNYGMTIAWATGILDKISLPNAE